MRKLELIKLGHGKYGELVILLREFLNMKENKKLKEDDDICYEQFRVFLKTKNKSHLLNEENLNQSFIGRDIRTWYNSEQPIHQLPNEIIPTMMADFLSVNGLASLRQANRFFASAISKQDLQNKAAKAGYFSPLVPRDYFANNVHSSILFTFDYLQVQDVILLPNMRIAVVGNEFPHSLLSLDTISSFFSERKDEIRIFDMRTKKEIHRLSFDYNERLRRDYFSESFPARLFLSSDNHLICKSNTHLHRWDINTWELLEKDGLNIWQLLEKNDSNFEHLKNNKLPNGDIVEWDGEKLVIGNGNESSVIPVLQKSCGAKMFTGVQFLPDGNIVTICSTFTAGFGPNFNTVMVHVKFPELTLENEMEAEQKTHHCHRI